jgi:hypothetical protein
MPNCIADTLTPEQRRKEVAAILGRGLLRFCSACKSTPEARIPAPENADQKALDVSAPGDPHVSWLTEPRT